jgi:hypothetical protein
MSFGPPNRALGPPKAGTLIVVAEFPVRVTSDRVERAAGPAMSASLIGRSGSSTFRLSAAAVSMSLTGSRFSSESAPRPLYGAFLFKKFK